MSNSQSSRTALVCSVLAGALALGPSTASAGGTRTHRVANHESFDAGETEGAAIESSGRVTVGYLPQRGEIKGSASAFSCLPQKKAVLVGTADKASIVRVFPNSSSKSKKATRPKKKDADKPIAMDATLKVETVAKLDGVVVTAMAQLSGGDVVAATLPGGKLVRVSPKGKVSPFATLPAERVWALLVHDGKLLAGTGPKGEVYSMSLSGKGAKVVLDADEKDILSLAAVGSEVVAGTAGQAKLLRITKDVEGELLHSFSGNDEVRAIAVTKTGLAVAVNRFSDRSLNSLGSLTKGLNRSSLSGDPPSGQLTSESSPQSDAALFFVDLGPKLDLARASEVAWQMWMKREKQYFTSLATQDGGRAVLVASSASGKVYRVRSPRDVSTVADFDERQTTSLCSLAKGPVFATVAHGAGAYQLRAAKSSQARYRTAVLDATQPANYGAVVLRGSGKIKVRARVGPTDEADDRWSDWSTIKLSRGADGLRGSLGGLPHRRYLEVEVTLAEARSELRGLEFFYAPENLPPLLKEVAVKRPEFKGSDKREPASDVTIKWKVDARDNDELIYDVRIRPEGADDSSWVKLTKRNDPQTERELKLDLNTVPDGVYEVEVTASDEPSNGSANARTDELVSDPFVVDRQRPSVSSVTVKGARLTAKARDDGGYVHDASYSIDGGSFRTASAGDGMFDSPSEDIVVDLPADLAAGKHRVVVRARDSFGNIGTAAVTVSR